MRLEELKKGFWGYRKEPVFQYLTQIEDACAQKLREREEQMEALRRQSQERIQALEEKLQDPEVATDYEAVTTTSQEIADLHEKGESLLLEWTQLSEELEELEQAAGQER